MKLNISKKILAIGLGVILVGAIGFAVVSASSTSRNSTHPAATNTEFHGHGRDGALHPGDCEGYGRSSADGERHSYGRGNAQRPAVGEGRGAGRGNNPGWRGNGNRPSETHAVPSDQWATISGKVVEASDNDLTLQTTSGTVEIGLGPIWYWEAHGITLNKGDSVIVKGFQADEFEPGQVIDETTGESVTLRNNEGMPLWAGGRH